MKFKIKSGIAVLAVSTAVLTGCSADNDSPGLEYMPDMYRSSAIEPYVDYGFVAEKYDMDKKMTASAMTPPFGSVPYYGTDSACVSIMLPYFRKPNISFKTTHGLTNVEFTTVDEYALAASDKNPLALTEDNSESIFKSGKELFNANCAHCHGEKGQADGPMMKSGAYSGAADLTALTIGDGQMFYSIYYGKGMMGAHGPTLNKKEIWTLVHYINKLQDGNYGPGSETTPEADATDAVAAGADNGEQ